MLKVRSICYLEFTQLIPCPRDQIKFEHTSQQEHQVEDQALNDTCSNMHSIRRSQEPEIATRTNSYILYSGSI